MFKRLALVFALILALAVPCTFAKGKSSAPKAKPSVVHVKGYTKKDGTYVAPHDRTAPNSTKNDNWSTKGNVNPETGKPGTKDPDSSPTATPPPPVPSTTRQASTHIRCCDNTLSPSCTYVHSGCCSHHGGVCQ
jgi:hypothetical protein